MAENLHADSRAQSPQSFAAVDIIRQKRDGGELSPAQIAWVIDAYTHGDMGDEQMAALAMAIFFQGMNPEEIQNWTQAMVDSGEIMDFSNISRTTVDKHSTGGVGDKISLPLAPLVASFGVAVPMLSGRGLGHTGGTLDKLESIPGWQADVSPNRVIEILESVGCMIAAASAELAPADKKIYALRDITATVDSIPLIASSIMSKKLAEGTAALVLDVKVGSGAFMKDVDNARKLAETMVQMGNRAGRQTRAFLTDMSTPLGHKVGNALEVAEAVEVLAGGGPADVVELTVTLAKEMLELAGVRDADPQAALRDGRAMDTWKQMIRAQGGDPDAPLPQARETLTVKAPRAGIISRLDALDIGLASWQLGAGRARKEDAVQMGAGVEIHVNIGEEVTAGQKLFTLHTDTPEKFAIAQTHVEQACSVVDPGTPVPERKIVLGKII
ncbi:pyrimidine-nucleoside phosphorylase [Actinobaculum suis]|uniref:thymidine phosphorylase n=1 Tax=Actinobaculum suis TaxID=1657 RepID=UPI00066FB90C|nr:thymidine phosphorylase [Actinobaculum suis]KMY24066.1 pyrimidine-nucleoside phosphorylase [Actinobaculum suis]